jgi:hypothetical protein
MNDDDRISQLTKADIDKLQAHLDRALATDHGSGDRWVLMAVLDRLGFRTNSPTGAMDKAEEVITKWYNRPK